MVGETPDYAHKRWVVDSDPSPYFPIYTRANIGEVFPTVVMPFSWTVWGIPLAIPGWRQAYVNIGAFDPDEFEDGDHDVLGVFGGYGYLNVSASRVFGVRAPGLSPEAIDASFFGSQPGITPYEARPADESPAHTERLGAMIGWVMSAPDLKELRDQRQEVHDLRAARPDLTALSDKDLLDRCRTIAEGYWGRFWTRHIMATYHSMVPPGAIGALCEAAGRPDLMADIISGVGDVDSALPAQALWDLSRLVRSLPSIAQAFDQGTEGLLERLERGDADQRDFAARFHAFLDEFGFRGPNEWEMRSACWDLDPAAPLGMIGKMRHQYDAEAPRAKNKERVAAREAAIKEIEARLSGNDEAIGQLHAAARAAAVFFAGRERTRTSCAMVTHEMRLPMWELGRRFTARGIFKTPQDFAYLTNDEWDRVLSDPEAAPAIVADRKAHEAYLAEREPPFVVDRVVPPIAGWPVRGAARARLQPDEILQGQPGCAGIARGRARIVRDAAEPGDLEPGDILVAPYTDPSWTPLFSACSGVVVNVGATVSHAVIVARELGIPCVVGIDGATERIDDGSEIEIDGARGTVRQIGS